MSIPNLLLFVTYLFAFYLSVLGDKRQLSECELKCHSSLTATEREQLCRGTHKGNTIGPALCAAEAKSKLSIKFDVLLRLCKGASSILPVSCYYSLSSSDRGRYGTDLCMGSTSDLPGRCWKELVGYSGGNKIKDVDLLDFCRSIDDDAPLQCVKATVTASLATASQALEPCKNATLDFTGSTITPQCIESIKKQVNPSRGFKPVDIINFCAHAGTNGSIECFEASASGLSTQPLSLNLLDRANLCQNAPGVGPVECAFGIIKNELRLRADGAVALCVGASGTGPAQCFRDSKSLGSETNRIQLCNRAINSGPANCFKRSQGLFKNNEELVQLLCVGAESDDPASCAHGSPQYLSPEEKVQLCQEAPPSRAQEPVKCLQLIEGPSHHFERAPSKGLGYFSNTLSQRSDRHSRDLLISMCSFSSSSQPLLSAECLKSSSFSLDHDDAVRMCTNATSIESSRHMTLCTKILPRDWQSSDSSILCDSVQSMEDAEGAVKCALESSHKLSLTKSTAAQLCHLDTKKNYVLQCALSAVPYPGPTTGVDSPKGIPVDVLIDVCSTATSPEPGRCLAKVFDHGRMQLERGAAELLCKSKEAMAKLGCLQNLRKAYLTVHDINSCVGEVRVVSGVKVIHFMSEDFKLEATAGKVFSLRIQLYDQWNQKLEFATFDEELTLSASINENNPQSAVLWGIRSNVTRKGVLELNRLMISQPGKVSFKISASRGQDSIAVFALHVKEDPATRNAGMCVSFFRSLTCPQSMSEADWISYFPRTKGYVVASRLFEIFQCADIFEKWHVGMYPSPDGIVWLDFRSGIDSIWTGNNLPRMELSFEQRLDLTPGVKLKEIRRAYYKKSLQWHPDRWAGMPIYSLVVQGAFELVNEAYEGLTSGLTGKENRPQK